MSTKREKNFVDETGLIKDVSMKWEDTKIIIYVSYMMKNT